MVPRLVCFCRGEDLTWQYGVKVNYKDKVRYNFYNKEMGGDVKGNVIGYNDEPPTVKEKMLKLITDGKGKKGGGTKVLIDEVDDEEKEFKVQMELARIASLQELNYRQMEIQDMYGRRDGASTSHQPQQPKKIKFPSARKLVENERKCISMFWYVNALRFNYTNSDYYLQMVSAITDAGPNVIGPTAKKLARPCLKVVVHDDTSHIHLVNFLIGSPKRIVYHSNIDLSRKKQTARLLSTYMNKILDEVGPENMVQVVTDNVANYRKTCLLLIERIPNIYWILCANHCVNLMLKNIGKLKRIKNCILKCKLITIFIYNHMYLNALMREHRKREILRDNESTWKGVIELLVQVLRLVDSDDKLAMWFLFDANSHAREAIVQNNIWIDEILAIVDRRWRDQLHRDIHTAGFFLNPHNLYSNATLDDPYIMEGVRNCIYRFEPNHDIQMKYMAQWIHTPRQNRLNTQKLYNLVQIRKTPTDYTPINLYNIIWKDLTNEWVSQRIPVLNLDFLRGAVANMDDNADIVAPNEGDTILDMDTDYHEYTDDEDEKQDDKETYEIMENDWQGPDV
ncbi:hypothetical protein AMTRI_Chr05g72490 [Amborella trichopoda]